VTALTGTETLEVTGNIGGRPSGQREQTTTGAVASGPLKTETTTARTLAASDNGATINFTNGSAVTLTVPSGLGAGFSCSLIQSGAGTVGVSAGGGVTINAASGATGIAAQYGGAALVAVAADSFVFFGNIA